jgi:hypothetical protein
MIELRPESLELRANLVPDVWRIPTDTSTEDDYVVSFERRNHRPDSANHTIGKVHWASVVVGSVPSMHLGS